MYFVDLFVADTLLSTDAALYHHLGVRTPVQEQSLTWTSDDSDTEQLISAAEQFLSTQTTDPLSVTVPNESTLSERRADDELGVSDAALHKPHLIKLSVEESTLPDPAVGDSAVTGPTEGCTADRTGDDLPAIHLSESGLDVQTFDGRMAYRLPQHILESVLNSLHLIVRHRSEPTASGEPVKLEHQASAPANLESTATSVNKESDATIIHKVPVNPEVPMTYRQLAADPCEKSVTLSLNLSQAGHETVFSSATYTRLLSESVPSAVGGGVMSQQSPEVCQGARPKLPPTSYSSIPVFVVEETLSEDEEELDRKQCNRTSSPIVLELSRTLPEMMRESPGGLATQIPVALVTSKSGVEQPIVSNIGILAELDLRNNDDDSVSPSY